MATRVSGFSRVPMDLYQTPAWVLDALVEHVKVTGLRVWEPAAGEGKLVAALASHGAQVFATDAKDYGVSRMDFRGLFDFTVAGPCPWISAFDFLITNPPYGARGDMATRFIELGLDRIGTRASMALLLPVDFDSAKTRRKFFGDCPLFSGKITLTKRINWFPPEAGKKAGAPSANHAWFIWGQPPLGIAQAPRLFYAPTLRGA